LPLENMPPSARALDGDERRLHRQAMLEVASGVWHDSGPVRIVGMKLTSNMTVLDIGDGGLLVSSPLPLTPERREAVTSLGRVAHLYAPNTFHHFWLGEWSAAFPEAQVHAPEALAKKRPELRIDRFHDRAAAPFADAIVEVPIAGFRLVETALVHRPSNTAVVADLVHNIGRPTDLWAKMYTSIMGFYDRVALSRVIRWTAFHDRAAARRAVDALLEHPFERLIVGHGAPITVGAREAIGTAMAWLPAARAEPTTALAPPRALFGRPCG
jgi:hypothetical protein